MTRAQFHYYRSAAAWEYCETHPAVPVWMVRFASTIYHVALVVRDYLKG